MKGVKRFGIKGKLSPRYIGPFKILSQNQSVAFELELPAKLKHSQCFPCFSILEMSEST
jgi:hypothetical protein